MVEQTVDVDVPVRNAYNQWTQFEDFPNFMEGVEDVRQTDDRHCHWKTKVAGVRREFDTEIVDQLPDERVAWRTVGGEVKQKGVVTFQQLDAGRTRVRLAMEVEPEGLTEKAGDALGFLDRRVKGDLKRFKDFIEERGRETGEWRGRISPSGDVRHADAPGGGVAGGAPGVGTSTGATPGGVPGAGTPATGTSTGGATGRTASRPAPETWELPPEPGEPGLR